MPANLTDSSTFTSPIQVPTNGDPVDAGPSDPLRAGFQGLANRTKYIKDLLDGGVRRVQYYSSTAALAAVTGMVNGDVAIVNSTYLGLYIYDTSNSGAAVLPWFVKPDGYADGTPGRWRHLFHSFGVNASSSLDENRWAIPVANAMPMAPQFITSNSTPVTLSGSYQDVGPSLSLASLLAGDVLVIDGDMTFDPNGSSNTATIGIKVGGENGDAVFTDSEVTVIASGSVSHRVHVQLACTLASAGTKVVQMRARDSGIVSGANQVKPRYQLRAMVVRP